MQPGTPQPRVILCVLAGGQSSRFGTSKLNVHLNGEPILAWQVRRLLGAVGRVIPGRAIAWLNLAPRQAVPPGAGAFERHIEDAQPHQGPLAGLAAVLESAHASDIVTFVPADMPLLTERELRRLAEELAEHADAAMVMARWSDGPSAERVEPLPCVCRAGAALALLRRAPHQGVSGPSHLASRPGLPTVRCVTLRHPADTEPWMSINTPEDLVTIATVLGVTAKIGSSVDDLRT